MAKKNRFGHNPTGSHYEKVITRLISETLHPLLEHTDYCDHMLVGILARLVEDRRSSLASIPINDAIQRMLLAISFPHDRAAVIKNVTAAQLDRSVWLLVCNQFYKIVESYPKTYRKWLAAKTPGERFRVHQRLSMIEQRACSNRDSLLPAAMEFLQVFDAMLGFKSSILHQYENLSLSLENRHVRSSSMTVSPSDLHQNTLEAVNTALNKYSSGKGALSHFAKYWMLNSLGQNSHLTNLAYDVPANVRKDIATGKHPDKNIATSLDAPLSPAHGGSSDEGAAGTLADVIADQNNPDPSEVIERQQLRHRIAVAAKLADHTGVLRLKLGIPDVITPREILLMEQHMRQQNIVTPTSLS